jgi:hypothetical protein
MRNKGLPLVSLGRAVRVNIVHMGEVRLKAMRTKSAGVRSLSETNILFFTQCDHLVYIEQFLAPFSEIGRINNDFSAEMANALLI